MTGKVLRSIFVTGASSGIGAALAQEYAAPGVSLGLAARRLDRLKQVARLCEKQGATVFTYKLDVADDKEFQKVASQFIAATGRIDIVVANAGLGGWNHPTKTTAAAMTKMVDVNVSGVVNALSSFLPKMEKQRSGQLVAISSVASFKSLPGGVYSATKAAVRYLMNGWRVDLEGLGIKVTTIYPGFVASEMTKPDQRTYPFLISAQKAARLIRLAIDRSKKNYILPWQWYLVLPILKLIPGSWLKRI